MAQLGCINQSFRLQYQDMQLISAIAATTIISLLSLVGLFTLSLKPKFLKKIVVFLVALSAGTLMGATFLHLLPEAIHELGAQSAMTLTMVAFVVFLLVEKLFHWQHCHKENCKVHTFGYMNLIGDGIHNFIDGLVIGAAFVVDIRLGWITTIAVASHELPQEIGDFGVLLHAGFSRGRALFYNLLSALTAVLGAVMAISLSGISHELSMMLLPFAAGSFLYISASDLLPELRKEKIGNRLLGTFIVFVMGIAMLWGMSQILPEHSHGAEGEEHSHFEMEHHEEHEEHEHEDHLE
jgi:zinc and cadmium transporter